MSDYKTYSQMGIEIKYNPCNKEKDEEVLAFEFINRIFKEFAKGCLLFYKPRRGLIDMPYYYSERRFDSVVLPVLHNLCNGLVLTELPVERIDRKTKEVIGSGHGRVDYWCIYRGYTFVIEMKRTLHNLNGTTIRQHSMIERWQEMHDQLETAREDLKGYTEKTKGIIPIGLHFVTTRTNSTECLNEESYYDYMESCEELIDEFKDSLANPSVGKKVKPDYSAAWLIPKNVALSSIKDYEMICPTVMLFGQIGRVIKHVGSK
ncbi:MAG: hypothetical protein MJZ16_11085 [Bacteroidales bacterium]|nr:hypothetical protein [Bacteroidales bacterium]